MTYKKRSLPLALWLNDHKLPLTSWRMSAAEVVGTLTLFGVLVGVPLLLILS